MFSILKLDNDLSLISVARLRTVLDNKCSIYSINNACNVWVKTVWKDSYSSENMMKIFSIIFKLGSKTYFSIINIEI